VKKIILLLALHLLAVQIVRAEEIQPVGSVITAEVRVEAEVKAAQNAQTTQKLDDCKDILPQMENDYLELEAKLKALTEGSRTAQDGYLVSFNDMTKVLFQLTEARVEETQKITASRDQLAEALKKFNETNTAQASQKLQDQYLDLTVRLYSAAMDSHKTIETLKTQISQVETTRSQYEGSRQEMDQLDQQKLALEAKLISLKIKCQPQKRY